jgi:hypothetical protein
VAGAVEVGTGWVRRQRHEAVRAGRGGFVRTRSAAGMVRGCCWSGWTAPKAARTIDAVGGRGRAPESGLAWRGPVRFMRRTASKVPTPRIGEGADARGSCGSERKRGRDGLLKRGHTSDAGKRASELAYQVCGSNPLRKEKGFGCFYFGLSKHTEKELTQENG